MRHRLSDHPLPIISRNSRYRRRGWLLQIDRHPRSLHITNRKGGRLDQHQLPAIRLLTRSRRTASTVARKRAANLLHRPDPKKLSRLREWPGAALT